MISRRSLLKAFSASPVIASVMGNLTVTFDSPAQVGASEREPEVLEILQGWTVEGKDPNGNTLCRGDITFKRNDMGQHMGTATQMPVEKSGELTYFAVYQHGVFVKSVGLTYRSSITVAYGDLVDMDSLKVRKQM